MPTAALDYPPEPMTIALLDGPAPLVDDATRREFLIGGLSLAALLAACGAPDAAAPAPSGSDDGRFPRTVAHKYGSTEIPAEPQRVVTVGLSDHDYVLALGVVPVGLTDWYGDYPSGTWPWAADELGDAQPEVMPRNEDRINFEKVAALRPDLVIGQYSGMTEADYALLSQFAAARAAHPAFEGLSAVVAEQFDPGTYFVRSATDPRTRFLASLGFVLPDEISALAGDLDGAEISTEQLSLPLAIDQLVPRLAAAVDGNPATTVGQR